MPDVLTKECTISCGHSGTVKLESDAKLHAGGSPVLVKSDIEGKTIDGCKPPTSTKPCCKVLQEPSGEAEKLRVGGKKVMLNSLTGTTVTTDGNPTGTLTATSGQSKLKAV